MFCPTPQTTGVLSKQIFCAPVPKAALFISTFQSMMQIWGHGGYGGSYEGIMSTWLEVIFFTNNLGKLIFLYIFGEIYTKKITFIAKK